MTINEVKNIRAFLALKPPADLLQAIRDIRSRLQKTITGKIRWVDPEGVHLTMNFFGDISEHDVSTISGAITTITSGTAPLALNIKTAGFFPDARRPRVIWIGMGGEVSRLETLHARIDSALTACGIPVEDRAFRPHLTLARIKSPQQLSGVAKIMEQRNDFDAGSFTSCGLTLFKSKLTPQGAIYSQLAHFPFQENQS